MKRLTLPFASIAIAMTLLIPGCVSAVNLKLIVEDRLGDVAPMYTADTYDYTGLFGPNSPIVQAGYFDMRYFMFSQKGSTYTFGMEMAADLPQEGDPLPQGVTLLQYTLWLDPEAWDWSPYSVPSYFVIRFQYDGLSYHAGLYTYVQEDPGDLLAELSYKISGSSFEVRFTADSIGDLPTFWLWPCVVAYFGNCSWKTYIDCVDYNAGAPGQLWTSIPWPPPEE
jgi:hypothetical protein